MLKIIAGIAIPLVIIFVIFDIRSWGRGGAVFSKRHKALRVSSAAILIAILVMVMLGGLTHRINAYAAMAYWTICIALAFALLVLSFADLRELSRCWAEEEKKLLNCLTQREEPKDGE